jgi:hypothetical protein
MKRLLHTWEETTLQEIQITGKKRPAGGHQVFFLCCTSY